MNWAYGIHSFLIVVINGPAVPPIPQIDLPVIITKCVAEPHTHLSYGNILSRWIRCWSPYPWWTNLHLFCPFRSLPGVRQSMPIFISTVIPGTSLGCYAALTQSVSSQGINFKLKIDRTLLFKSGILWLRSPCMLDSALVLWFGSYCYVRPYEFVLEFYMLRPDQETSRPYFFW